MVMRVVEKMRTQILAATQLKIYLAQAGYQSEWDRCPMKTFLSTPLRSFIDKQTNDNSQASEIY